MWDMILGGVIALKNVVVTVNRVLSMHGSWPGERNYKEVMQAVILIIL